MNSMNDDLKTSVVRAMDGRDGRLYPYLPYLLQDLWEIGAFPDAIVDLVKNNIAGNLKNLKIIDLGCGKGAVAVKMAKTLGCEVLGLDAMPDFIAEAKQWAEKYKVSGICRFKVADIREKIKKLSGFDLAVLGSIGPVFGSVKETILTVTKCLKVGGYIILDDGFLPDDTIINREHYLKKSEFFGQLAESGVEIVAESSYSEDEMSESDAEIYKSIERRALELMDKHPEDLHVFEDYLTIQREENELLEKYISCITLLLKTKV